MRIRSVAVSVLLMGALTSGTTGSPGASAGSDDGTAAADLLGDITFSVPGGAFTDRIEVALTTDVAGAEIRYTTDGALPGPTSTRYSGSPVVLTETTQLRAQPFVDGAAAGDPGTAVYLATEVTTDHDLPVVVLDLYGAGEPRKADGYKDTAVMVFDPDPRTGVTSPSGTPTLATRAGSHVRGQTNGIFDKRSYRLELWDNEGKDADHPFLGMSAEADWVFRGPFTDKSLLRDTFTYSLGAAMGLTAPHFEFCELYLNLDGGPLSDEDYLGVYVVSDNIEVGENRVDITDIKKRDVAEPEVTGGYIFKFEWKVAEEPIIPCTGSTDTCWRFLELVEPDEPQPEQLAWITDYVQGFHDALYSESFDDPQEGYAAWIDVPSFVDYAIINELSRNIDAYMRSAYFHKDRNGKIVAGPLWDYDMAWGAGNVRNNLEIEGWQHEQQIEPPVTNTWFTRLFEDPAFTDQVSARWQELRRGPLSDAALDARAADLAEPLTAAAERNFVRWPNLRQSRMLGWVVTPSAPTWQGQIDAMLDWTHDRAAWLDTQWG